MQMTCPSVIAGKYKVIDTLGSGSYGLICKSLIDHTEVAIKTITDKASFYTESSIISICKHPNIISPTEIIDDQYIVMPLAENGDLQTFYEKNKMTINFIRDIAYRLIHAGIYMEQNRILHRDIKPSNIVITNTLIPIIIDFGLGIRHTDPKDPLSNRVQTSWYRAPEIAALSEETRSLYDSKIDVWSMGLVIANMVTRRPLYTVSDNLKWNEENEELLNTIVSNFGVSKTDVDAVVDVYNIDPPRKYKNSYMFLRTRGIDDPILINLLTHMLEFVPSKRYTFSQCLSHPWFQNMKITIDAKPINIHIYREPKKSSDKRDEIIDKIDDIYIHFKYRLSTRNLAIAILDRFGLYNPKTGMSSLILAAMINDERLFNSKDYYDSMIQIASYLDYSLYSEVK